MGDAHLGKAHNPRLLISPTRSSPADSRPPATQHLLATAFQLTSLTPQDGLLSAMLLLCQPAHGRADDGSHDSRTQCLLHCPPPCLLGLQHYADVRLCARLSLAHPSLAGG